MGAFSFNQKADKYVLNLHWFLLAKEKVQALSITHLMYSASYPHLQAGSTPLTMRAGIIRNKKKSLQLADEHHQKH